MEHELHKRKLRHDNVKDKVWLNNQVSQTQSTSHFNIILINCIDNIPSMARPKEVMLQKYHIWERKINQNHNAESRGGEKATIWATKHKFKSQVQITLSGTFLVFFLVYD